MRSVDAGNGPIGWTVMRMDEQKMSMTESTAPGSGSQDSLRVLDRLRIRRIQVIGMRDA